MGGGDIPLESCQPFTPRRPAAMSWDHISVCGTEKPPAGLCPSSRPRGRAVAPWQSPALPAEGLWLSCQQHNPALGDGDDLSPRPCKEWLPACVQLQTRLHSGPGLYAFQMSSLLATLFPRQAPMGKEKFSNQIWC